MIGTVPAALVELGSNQSVPPTTDTFLNFDITSFDTDSMHNNVHPDRLTAPIAGIYLVTASVVWGSIGNATEIHTTVIGSAQLVGYDTKAPTSAGGASDIVSGTVSLNAGDYVHVSVLQNSSASQPVHGDAVGLTRFSMVWLAPQS
jgi:hypothetical protein